MTHFGYVAMLVFCLVGTLPLIRLFHLELRPLRVAAAILVAAAPFVAWDIWATHAGHWRFDPAQTLGGRVAGLPLEELAFFVVIPLAAILTYETVRTMHNRPSRDREAEREEVS